MRIVFLFLFVGLAIQPVSTSAQQLLQDVNGDEIIRVLAFGDSLTFGVGDGVPAGAFIEEAPRTDGSLGYPARVRSLGGIEVINAGSPGELITDGAVSRFASAVQNTNPDTVVFFEGSNDSVFQISQGAYRNALQRMINIARALGKNVLVGTLPPTCCDRGSQNLFINLYNNEALDVININQVALLDNQLAFEKVCPLRDDCEYLNRPEGIHPNARGYDLISELVLGALFGIDLFQPGGSAALEEALGLEPGSVTLLAPEPQPEEGEVS